MDEVVMEEYTEEELFKAGRKIEDKTDDSARSSVFICIKVCS